ncbi:MAG: hypothetical protein IJM20_01265 [Clostridia bacterium]|nr:hypothetical protein [Clostridia bacterium]
MTNVLALELDRAVSILEAEGFAVETVEARSLKGVPGSDAKRVIRQTELSDPRREKRTVRLVYSLFKTAADIFKE